MPHKKIYAISARRPNDRCKKLSWANLYFILILRPVSTCGDRMPEPGVG
jgi:hypothetical protein